MSKNNKQNPRPIKTIAGELLLYFYHLQRKDGTPIGDIIRFSSKYHGPIKIEGNEKLVNDMIDIAKNSHVDLFNAFNYLKEKLFIDFKESTDTGGNSYHSLKVSAYGVDIIEGIERGKKEKEQFNITFNIKLADNINIDSLIKTELGSIIKNSLI